jgi:hypothetical protein
MFILPKLGDLGLFRTVQSLVGPRCYLTEIIPLYKVMVNVQGDKTELTHGSDLWFEPLTIIKSACLWS